MRPNNIWLYTAIGISIIILVGMSLPWAKALDFGGRAIGIRSYSGWNVTFLFLPVMAAIITYIIPFWKDEKRKLLYVALAFGALSLVIMVFYAVSIFRHTNELLVTTTPLFGFWLTLLGIIALLVIAALALFGKKIFPAAVPYVAKK